MEHTSLQIINIIHKGSNCLYPFIHALKLALASKGSIEIVDVRGDNHGGSLPGVREMLEKWGLLPPGSSREDVGRLGLHVKKIVKKADLKKEIKKRLERHHQDILVIDTHSHKGIGNLFSQNLEDYLAEYLRQTTLFMPLHTKPFIDPETGSDTLKKILVPVAEDPSPEQAIKMTRSIVSLFPDRRPQIILLHSGEYFPYISPSLLEGFSCKEVLSKETVVHSIETVAGEEDADMIVMSTNGRDTLAQKIVGSITENVLNVVRCPVLVVAVR